MIIGAYRPQRWQGSSARTGVAATSNCLLIAHPPTFGTVTSTGARAPRRVIGHERVRVCSLKRKRASACERPKLTADTYVMTPVIEGLTARVYDFDY
jgi:hypothetical protein